MNINEETFQKKMETPGEALQAALREPEFYQQLFSQYRLQSFKKWPFDPKSAKTKTKHKCTSDLVSFSYTEDIGMDFMWFECIIPVGESRIRPRQ